MTTPELKDVGSRVDGLHFSSGPTADVGTTQGSIWHRALLALCVLQVLLSAFYLLNPAGTCSHCSRSVASLLVAAAGMILYSVALFVVWTDRRNLIWVIGAFVGMTHVILAGALVRQGRPCAVCYTALAVGIGIVVLTMILARPKARLLLVGTLAASLLVAFTLNPYAAVERMLVKSTRR